MASGNAFPCGKHWLFKKWEFSMVNEVFSKSPPQIKFCVIEKLLRWTKVEFIELRAVETLLSLWTLTSDVLLISQVPFPCCEKTTISASDLTLSIMTLLMLTFPLTAENSVILALTFEISTFSILSGFVKFSMRLW